MSTKGMICPKCNSHGPFKIEAISTFTAYYDGGTCDHDDAKWDDSSYCMCDDCGHEARVSDFKG